MGRDNVVKASKVATGSDYITNIDSTPNDIYIFNVTYLAFMDTRVLVGNLL